MNTAKRFSISIVIALLTALSITFVAQAVSGPYTITEDTLYYVSGATGLPTTLSSSACKGGYCAYKLGTTTSVSWYRWEYTTAHTYQIYAYDPTIGESVAKYTWKDKNSWNVTVNQANAANKGTWVYLGFSDYVSTNTGGYLTLNTDCTGWTCGKKVLWDSMRYTTNP